MLNNTTVHMTDMDTWLIRRSNQCLLQWGQIHNGVQHRCATCGILLLTGETAGFCCGPNGRRFHDVGPLPALPAEYSIFLHDPRLSSLSRILNLLFSFASLETTHSFPHISGPPGFVAIQGKVYHRIRPDHHDSAIRWILYDGFMNNIPHADLARQIPPQWIRAVHAALSRVNPFVRALRQLSQQIPQFPSAQLLLHDSGASPEIAACMTYDNTTSQQLKPRQLVVSTSAGHIQHVPTVSRMWEPLAYPVFFPHGTLGWGLTDAATTNEGSDAYEDSVDAPTTQMWHYRARLLRDDRFRIFGRLTNEYVVDMFSRDLESRLAYIRANQQRLRREESALTGEDDPETLCNIYLPASFLGSSRWASEQIADTLAIAAALGNPTFFITMTCNPEWPEIRSQLLPGQDFTDVPVVVTRVFKRKLAVFENTLKTTFLNAGHLDYTIHSIEFQKRGLPHTHILIRFPSACLHPDDIDRIVSAEMPQDPKDAELVSKYMMHKHPSAERPPSKYCQKEDDTGHRTCRFHYPQRLQAHTIIDSDGRVHYRRRHPGDEWIVPYCLPLLRQFECHINFEVCCTSHIFQYLFKYIQKGITLRPFHMFIQLTFNEQVLIVLSIAFVIVTTTNLSTKLTIIGMHDTCPRERLYGAYSASMSR
jgi:hypothetical protein